MQEVTSCPFCRTGDLVTIGATIYARHDAPAAEHAGVRWAHRVQRDLVFGEWLPGRDAVELRELACARCGGVTASPRPTAADIARKYELLAGHGVRLGHGGAGTPGEALRARQLRDRLGGHLPEASPRVLDVGGGDGAVLAALAGDGARCFVVDYETSQVPGVVRLGAVLDDVPPGLEFDAAVLGHVLEHVADPGGLLEQVAARAPVLYAEVPVEIWRGTPIGRDPVTHVNHFVRESLVDLLAEHGWRTLRSRQQLGLYRGAPLELAWAVAVRDDDPPRTGSALRAVRRRLAPGPARRLARRGKWRWFVGRARRRGLLA